MSERRQIRKGLNRKAFAQRVRRALLDQVPSGSRLLLAVSGGPDSTAMALAVASFADDAGFHLGIVSIDHQLRDESASEVRFVGDLAKRLGVPFFTQKIVVPKAVAIEANARRLRYRALKSIARKEGFQFIATAHTANDQAETVLLRLGRGSALKGQRAVLARRGPIVRPMLAIERSAVVAFLEDAEVEAVRDPSNFDTAFTRARLRQGVIPEITRSLGSSAVRNIARSATLAAEDEALLAKQARRLYRKAVHGDPRGALIAEARHLRSSPAPWVRRVIVRMAREIGARAVALSHVDATLRRLHDSGPWRAVWPGGLVWNGQGGSVQVERAMTLPALSVQMEGPGSYEHHGLRVTVDRVVFRVGLKGLCVPVGVHLPLEIRPVRVGGRMRPLGGRGTRKVKDVLIDQGVPRASRSGVIAVYDREGAILGLYGIRPSSAAACKPGDEVFQIQIASLGDPSPWTLEVTQARGGARVEGA